MKADVITAVVINFILIPFSPFPLIAHLSVIATKLLLFKKHKARFMPKR